LSPPTLVDTSILARARDIGHPRRAACVDALRRLIATGRPCICAQVLIEFWAVATRPREVNGLGLTLEEAERDLDDWEQSLELLPEPPDVGARWHALVRQYAVQGRQSHDARLVAVMLAHGVTRVLTLNPQHLGRYAEIVCLAPEDVCRRGR
jgi:predicted nucleic acid-binding protein